jgi:hypothetical protein
MQLANGVCWIKMEDDDVFDDDIFDDNVSDGKDVFDDAFVVDCERGRCNDGSAEALTG